MGLAILAAVLGYSGEGPASEARAPRDDGAYEVEFSRYARHRAPEVLRVAIDEGAAQSDQVQLSFHRAYLDGLQVESVFPEPESVEVGGDEVVYLFQLRRAGAAATVIFDLMYEDIGRKQALLRLDGHPPVSISQFIYP